MYELYNFAQKTGKNYNTVVAPSVKWLKVSEHFSKLQNTSKGGGGGGGGGGGRGRDPLWTSKRVNYIITSESRYLLIKTYLQNIEN